MREPAASASRLSESESTSYAATNFRNWTAASGEAFTSGWRLLACFLNASRTVASESDGVTPLGAGSSRNVQLSWWRMARSHLDRAQAAHKMLWQSSSLERSGEAAIMSKWGRTEWAGRSGAFKATPPKPPPTTAWPPHDGHMANADAATSSRADAIDAYSFCPSAESGGSQKKVGSGSSRPGRG